VALAYNAKSQVASSVPSASRCQPESSRVQTPCHTVAAMMACHMRMCDMHPEPLLPGSLKEPLRLHHWAQHPASTSLKSTDQIRAQCHTVGYRYAIPETVILRVESTSLDSVRLAFIESPLGAPGGLVMGGTLLFQLCIASAQQMWLHSNKFRVQTVLHGVPAVYSM
jgi:hypothetical protein